MGTTRFLLPVLSLVLHALTHPSLPSPISSAEKLDDPNSLTIPVKTIHQFPPGTWIENLAVRSNGQILLTQLAPSAQVYLLDPHNKISIHNPILIHEFNDIASVLGIVETEPDIFYICTANYSSTTLEAYGQGYIYRIDMRDFSPSQPSSAAISKVATVPEAQALDGLTYVPTSGSQPEHGVLLTSDLLLGVIWSVDLSSGEVSLEANNTYTRSASGEGFQTNGLKTLDSYLYFTVTESRLWAKAHLHTDGGIGTDYTILSNGSFTPDDFALDLQGNAHIASLQPGANGIVYVDAKGGESELYAHVKGPTAVAFGRTPRDCHILYISTSGGDEDYALNGTFTGAGTLSKVDLGVEAALGCKRRILQQATVGWTTGFG